MTTLVYDDSLEGLLSAVFYVFEEKLKDVEIVRQSKFTAPLFSEHITIVSDSAKAERVIKRLHTQTDNNGTRMLIYSFFSEDVNMEKHVLAAIRYAIANPNKNVWMDFAHPDVLQLTKYTRSVGREKHRMEAFVRFEKYKDEIYVAKIDPDFNVLPLIAKHFKNRYQDQKWIIYDLRRNFGLYYNLETTEEIYLENKPTLQNDASVLHEEEQLYQKLWQRYFIKTNIQERKNTKLHVQHIPKRYWKYLTEKKV